MWLSDNSPNILIFAHKSMVSTNFWNISLVFQAHNLFSNFQWLYRPLMPECVGYNFYPDFYSMCREVLWNCNASRSCSVSPESIRLLWQTYCFCAADGYSFASMCRLNVQCMPYWFCCLPNGLIWIGYGFHFQKQSSVLLLLLYPSPLFYVPQHSPIPGQCVAVVFWDDPDYRFSQRLLRWNSSLSVQFYNELIHHWYTTTYFQCVESISRRNPDNFPRFCFPQNDTIFICFPVKRPSISTLLHTPFLNLPPTVPFFIDKCPQLIQLTLFQI